MIKKNLSKGVFTEFNKKPKIVLEGVFTEFSKRSRNRPYLTAEEQKDWDLELKKELRTKRINDILGDELTTAVNTVLNNYGLKFEDLDLELHNQIQDVTDKYAWKFSSDHLVEALYKELERTVGDYIIKYRKSVISEILK